ncbi:phosphotransferase family protein [Cohnella terricola]|uniref:Aminoglycoside phosphotransferase family protein n=1 Tax=Cohnella terricola TaxID=1289167 RepID=A0A559JMT0_9BACL|nr:aminoglycoside phosphotransferase family protein [Cohnella terricola]TVY01182.1 aminoglycoside phosphotransferase family protein [Cohnella terricola]
MQGIYKTKLPDNQLREVVRETFGCGLLGSAEMHDGWANSAYVLELDDGRKTVLKASPSSEVKLMRCEIGLMKSEVEAMRRFDKMEDVPVPRIYAYDTSKGLIPVDYFIMDFIEGKPLNQIRETMPAEQLDGIYRRLGEINRRINEVSGTLFGFYARPSDGSWRDAFAEMIGGVIADGRDAGVEWPIDLAELERRIEARLDVLKEVTEPRLLHWDLWDGNIFVKDGQVSGIVDFERAIWGDPLMEFYFGHFHGSDAFMAGYGMPPFTPAQIERRKLYDLYLDLIMHVECTYRQYGNQDHVRWARDNLVQSLARFGEA